MKTPPRSLTSLSSPSEASSAMLSASTRAPTWRQRPGSSEQEAMRPLPSVTKMSLPEISAATERLILISQLKKSS